MPGTKKMSPIINLKKLACKNFFQNLRGDKGNVAINGDCIQYMVSEKAARGQPFLATQRILLESLQNHALFTPHTRNVGLVAAHSADTSNEARLVRTKGCSRIG